MTPTAGAAALQASSAVLAATAAVVPVSRIMRQASSLMPRGVAPRRETNVTVTVVGLEYQNSDGRLRVESLTFRASVPAGSRWGLA